MLSEDLTLNLNHVEYLAWNDRFKDGPGAGSMFKKPTHIVSPSALFCITWSSVTNLKAFAGSISFPLLREALLSSGDVAVTAADRQTVCVLLCVGPRRFARQTVKTQHESHRRRRTCPWRTWIFSDAVVATEGACRDAALMGLRPHYSLQKQHNITHARFMW